MNTFTRRLLSFALLCVVTAPAVAIAGAAADPLVGAWSMESYTGSAATGPATGQLIFSDGRFSLIYTMGRDGQSTSGRAHAGAYKLDGEDLDLQVMWSMGYVNGKGSVTNQPSSRPVKTIVKDDQLTMTFGNGSVQTFKRIKQ
jgi:hypothetical protein